MTARQDRAVRFDRTGGPEVFRVVDAAVPEAGPGEVRVRVAFAGLNPVDAKIASGGPSRYALTLPSGNGNDWSGVVDAVGPGVDGVVLGDEVFGGARFHAQADHVVVAADRVSRVPVGLALREAAVLDIAGRTAWASIEEVGVSEGDTVLVGAAAGGVGVIAAQLARVRGARVIGTGAASTAGFLRDLGVEPVEYGEGLVERVRALAPDGVGAVLDYAGRGTVDAGLALGVPAARINTNADGAAVERHGVRNAGAHTWPEPDGLRVIADLAAAGRLRIPIAAEYPLEDVVAAYEDLLAGHTHGKIVLRLG